MDTDVGIDIDIEIYTDLAMHINIKIDIARGVDMAIAMYTAVTILHTRFTNVICCFQFLFCQYVVSLCGTFGHLLGY